MFVFFSLYDWGFVAAVEYVGSPDWVLVLTCDNNRKEDIPPFLLEKQEFLYVYGGHDAKS